MVAFEATINIYSMWQAGNATNNLPSLHLLIFAEVLFAGIYYHQILITKVLKRLVIIIASCFLIYTTFNSLYFKNINEVVSVARGLQCLVMVCLAFIYLYELLKKRELMKLSRSSSFIISMGIIFYFSSSQFYWLLKYHVGFYDPTFLRTFHFMHYFINVIYYPILAVGLWKKNY